MINVVDYFSVYISAERIPSFYSLVLDKGFKGEIWFLLCGASILTSDV